MTQQQKEDVAQMVEDLYSTNKNIGVVKDIVERPDGNYSVVFDVGKPMMITQEELQDYQAKHKR